jgi:hypothetical protein
MDVGKALALLESRVCLKHRSPQVNEYFQDLVWCILEQEMSGTYVKKEAISAILMLQSKGVGPRLLDKLREALNI